MFKPNFKYTDEIVNNIAEIEFVRSTIVNADIIPEVDISLKRNALVKSAYASTSIEGNPLTISDVDRLLKGQQIRARKTAQQEVLNYLNVLKNIKKYQKNNKITHELILKMHNDVSKNTLENPYYEGRYRDIPNRVENLRTGEIRYTPPSPTEVQTLMENLINWINEPNHFYPAIVAAIAHYEFVRIHPFVDGNGRTARALATLILNIKDFDVEQYFALDEHYDEDRKTYADTLKSTDESGDLTEWIEYFLEGVLISVTRVKDYIEKIPLTTEFKDKKPINEEQIRIIEYLQEKGKITNKEIQELIGITSQAAYYHINKLQELGILKREGAGRATYYILKRVKSKNNQ